LKEISRERECDRGPLFVDRGGMKEKRKLLGNGYSHEKPKEGNPLDQRRKPSKFL